MDTNECNNCMYYELRFSITATDTDSMQYLDITKIQQLVTSNWQTNSTKSNLTLCYIILTLTCSEICTVTVSFTTLFNSRYIIYNTTCTICGCGNRDTLSSGQSCLHYVYQNH